MELAHHDIGVIILPTNVPADVATPVKIYTGGYNEETVFTVAGYGVTKDGSTKLADDLMQAELKIGDKVFCEHSDPMWDIATQICLARNDGRDTCVGDSGGPAVVHDKDGKIALLGITSFGAGAQLRNPKCGADNVAGYYTDASKYISWIASATDLRAAKFTTANSTGNSATRPYNGDTTNNYFSQYMELLEASSLEYLDVEETTTAS
ncbi:Kallikrein-8, partial [Linderina pennispora]